MVLSTLAALVSLPSPTVAAPVTLARTFTKGERLSYRVHSSLSVEKRQRGLQTWMPEDLDLSYGFTLDVTALKADGIAVLRYKRPTFTIVEGETHNAPPKTRVDKVNMDYQLTISPLNEILEAKDLAKRPARQIHPFYVATSRTAQSQILGGALGSFISDLYRLSLFIGSFDAALDFSPKFSLDEVKVGDTWKTTVSYQPQRLKGTGKQSVQRLDYTYTYKGLVKVGKANVERVQATLNLNTDLADFVHDNYGLKASDTGLKGVPMTLNAKIDFDLDPKTRRTLKATATAEGGFRVLHTAFPDEPLEEQKLNGVTVLRLVSAGPVKSAPKKRNLSTTHVPAISSNSS